MTRDPDLDELLAPLRSEAPAPLARARWKKALARAARPRFPIAEIAAAAIVGFLLGGASFLAARPLASASGATLASRACPGAEILALDATVERSHVKLD